MYRDRAGNSAGAVLFYSVYFIIENLEYRFEHRFLVKSDLQIHAWFRRLAREDVDILVFYRERAVIIHKHRRKVRHTADIEVGI